MDSTLCIGIDAAQNWLDLAAHSTGKPRRFKTTPDGLRSLVEHCRDTHPRLIAFEASGGYERPLADTLTQAQLPFAILNPRNVRYHARSTGILAKTDAGSTRRARPTRCSRSLAVARRDRPCVDLVTRRNPSGGPDAGEHQARTSPAQAWPGTSAISPRLRHGGAAAEGLAQDVLPAQERSERLRSVPGVGETLAAALLGAMPELGSLNRGAVGMLAGLAPHARDSGKREGKRFCPTQGAGSCERPQDALYDAIRPYAFPPRRGRLTAPLTLILREETSP